MSLTVQKQAKQSSTNSSIRRCQHSVVQTYLDSQFGVSPQPQSCQVLMDTVSLLALRSGKWHGLGQMALYQYMAKKILKFAPCTATNSNLSSTYMIRQIGAEVCPCPCAAGEIDEAVLNSVNPYVISVSVFAIAFAGVAGSAFALYKEVSAWEPFGTYITLKDEADVCGAKVLGSMSTVTSAWISKTVKFFAESPYVLLCRATFCWACYGWASLDSPLTL